MKKQARIILAIAAAVLTSFVLFSIENIMFYGDTNMGLRDFTAMKTVLACLLSVFYRRKVFTDEWQPPKNIIKALLSVCLALMSSLALLSGARNITGHKNAIDIVIRDFGVTGLIAAVLLCVFYRKTLFSDARKHRVRVCTLVFSSVLALCMLLGTSFQAVKGWDFLMSSAVQAVWSFVLFIGYVSFFCVFLETAFAWLDGAVERHKAGETTPKIQDGGAPKRKKARKSRFQARKICDLLLDKRPFLIPFALFFLAWLPYWIAFFPGSTHYDFLTQMTQYFGLASFSDHHPVFSTLVLGWPMHLGRMISSDTLGLSLIVLLQTLITAGACAYAMQTIRAWGAPRSIRAGVLAFLALHPFIGFMVQTAMKDTLSTTLLFAFCLLYLDIIRNIKLGRPMGRRLAAACAVALLASLMRHNNLYIAALSLAALVLIKQGAARRLVLACAALLFFFGARFVSGALADALNANPGSISEALSIPFQQTARYLLFYGYDVTPKEREAIDAVLDFQRLPQLYNPESSDSVKVTYKYNDAVLPAYFEAWRDMFPRHPDAYIQATISNSFSYYCPTGQSNVRDIVIKDISGGPAGNSELFRFEGAPQEDRQAMYDAFTGIRTVPVIGVFANQGSITWMVLAIALWLYWKKRYVYIIGFVPAIVTLLTCIASPINGYCRYHLPILMMLPLLFAFAAVVYDAPPQKVIGKEVK